ncbi:MAG: rRNA maturation RNase YbeY [Candidatus Harrisonbacteria bacterium]|nr:rRNA maturation RNase YbeY [Candidatus Harrisonbacteria bacterium]
MITVVVESFKKGFDRLKPTIKRDARKLANFLREKNAYLEIFLVDDSFMNKNVLAFPAPKEFPRPDIKGKWLGEIYLNPHYIKKHDEDPTYMLIHGFLHLLGYDHLKKNDRIRMQKEENRLLKFLRSHG